MYGVAFFTLVVTLKYAHSEYSENFQPNDWMLHVAEGFDVAKTIAEKEGFVITDEISEMRFYRFSNINPDKEQKEETYIRLSRYEEISLVKPIVPELTMKGLLRNARVPDAPYISDNMLLPFMFYPNFRMGPNFINSKDTQDPRLKSKPKILCAGPTNKAIKTDMPLAHSDPLYQKQWFMRSCEEIIEHVPSHHDLKLAQTRQDFNLYGDGVTVVVIDDGVSLDHEDLDIDLNYSYNFYTKTHDPSPTHRTDKHGTSCSGIIGMKEDNGICGVGIAPHARIGGLKVFNGETVDPWVDTNAYQFKAPDVDVMSRSLRADEDQAFSTLNEFKYSAIQRGITKGRHGKGIIYVFVAGNNKEQTNTCSVRALENSIYSITIAGVDHDGKTSKYSERCAAIMAAVYSGDGYPYAIPTVDARGGVKCDENFNGTSAAAPLAAGLFALVVQANPNLTWREIQHLVAWTSKVAPLIKNPGWVRNAAGFYASLDFGFGLLDVYDMAEMATNFEPIGPMHSCSTDYTFDRAEALFNLKNPMFIKLSTNGCKGTATKVNYIEFVELTIIMRYAVRGDLQIRLISPQKTGVQVLEKRPHDGSNFPINGYSFTSVHTWGENPQGDWIIQIADENGREVKKGKISYVAITIHGTDQQPHHYKRGHRKYYNFTTD